MHNRAMRFRRKGWPWYLTWPFAHNNFTTIWDTVYGPYTPSLRTWQHEAIHYRQQQEWGLPFLPLWILLYLIALPFFFNPMRYRMEYEAYRYGSGYTHAQTKATLRSLAYGYLPYWLHKWAVKDLIKVD